MLLFGFGGRMLTRIAKITTSIMIAIGASALAMMMFLTAMDVGLRYAFNRPLAGAFELVEYLMAIVIPFSIVFCAYRNQHVAVELILGKLSDKIQLYVNIATTFASIVFIIAIAWQSFLYIKETYSYGTTSAVLLIPTYPFVVPIAIGLAAFALNLIVHLSQYISEVKKR
jgi:TRAP-type C4-dicarboxylate transport system permease small subunit